IGCLAWAVAHVRRWHTRRSGSLVSRAPSASRLPSLGDEAMLWKELYVERISRVTPIVQASFTAIVSLGPLLVLLFYDQLTFLYHPADARSEEHTSELQSR